MNYEEYRTLASARFLHVSEGSWTAEASITLTARKEYPYGALFDEDTRRECLEDCILELWERLRGIEWDE